MEDPSRPGPSRLDKARPLPFSPDNGRTRPRAVVMPNILQGDQIIRPLTAENLNVQVAVIKISEHGQYFFIRTGALIIDPATNQARDPSAPVPVELPNEDPLADIATVLPLDLVQIILPNVTDRHQQMLADLDRDESRIPSMSWAVQELERQCPTARLMGAWGRMLQAMEQDVERRLPQALDERYGSTLHSLPVLTVSHASYFNRRLRANRRLRSSTPPRLSDQLQPIFTSPLEACQLFLGQLRSLARGHPRLERSLRTIVQLVVDDVLSPQQFCRRLEGLLSVIVQPYLVRFLTKYMHRLRQSLYLNLTSLEGIDRPDRRVAFPIPAPQPELPPVGQMGTAGPMGTEGQMGTVGTNLPVAAIAPLQPVPLAHIPYDLPIPLAPIHLFGNLFSSAQHEQVWQVEKGGLPAMIKTKPKEGDVHLYNPRVGYVHLRVMPTANSFQLGNTTIKLLPKKPVPPSPYHYVYRY